MIDASAATAPRDSALADTVTEGLVFAGGCPGGDGPGEPVPGPTGEEEPPQDVAQRTANTTRTRASGCGDDTVIVSFAGEETTAPFGVGARDLSGNLHASAPADRGAFENDGRRNRASAIVRPRFHARGRSRRERSRFANRLTQDGGDG